MTSSDDHGTTGADAPGLLDGDAFPMLQRLARAVHAPTSGLEQTLEAILQEATGVVDGADHAGLNLVISGVFRPRATVGEPPRVLDAWQVEAGTGPCIDAARTQTTVLIPRLAADDRWPDYGARATELGVRSMMCIALRVDGDALGSLSLYSRREDAFDERAVLVAELLATHAAIALAENDRRQNLERALQSRDVIGQAKGILMERHRFTADQAFALLSAASQTQNRKLTDIAAELAGTGAIEGLSPR